MNELILQVKPLKYLPQHFHLLLIGNEVPCPEGEASDNGFTPGCECK